MVEFEKKKVPRCKVSVSPKKIKRKLVSESIKDKMKCYDKINIKNESSVKVVKIEKLSKLKDNLNENVKLPP